MTNTIITGLAGSRKTYHVAETIIPQHSDNLHIYFAPSIALGEQFASMVKDPTIIKIIINCETDNSGNVLDTIIKQLRVCEAQKTRFLVISTHQIYFKLSQVALASWNVYVDEAVADIRVSKVDFGDTGTVDTYFNTDSNGYLSLASTISNNAANHKNLSTQLRQLIAQVGSGRYIAKLSKEPDAKQRAEAFIAPSESFWVGKSITYIGAGIEGTRVASLLPNARIMVRESKNLNHLSSNIQIRYYLDGSNSKYARLGSKEVIDEIIEDNDVFHLSVDKPLFWHNKYEEYGESMNHNIAGSNEYQDSTHATFFTSMNIPRHILKVSEELGIGSDYLYDTLTLETAYQCFMRTNLRKDDETKGTVLTVLDSKLANALKEKFFPNASIIKVGDFEWIKKEKKTRYSLRNEIGTTHYIKLTNIIKNNVFATDDKKEIYNSLKANGSWDKYKQSGEAK